MSFINILQTLIEALRYASTGEPPGTLATFVRDPYVGPGNE